MGKEGRRRKELKEVKRGQEPRRVEGAARGKKKAASLHRSSSASSVHCSCAGGNGEASVLNFFGGGHNLCKEGRTRKHGFEGPKNKVNVSSYEIDL